MSLCMDFSDHGHGLIVLVSRSVRTVSGSTSVTLFSSDSDNGWTHDCGCVCRYMTCGCQGHPKLGCLVGASGFEGTL